MKTIIFYLSMILCSIAFTAIEAQETKIHPVQIHSAGADEDQVLTYDGTKWIAADANSGTDDQAISLSGNTLTLEDGGTVDLSPYLDNTDDQAISLSGNTLTLESGGTVNLAPYLDNTDNQAISLSGNTLTLEDGGTVNLSPYLDNTDAQTLTYNATTGNIAISNGNNFTLSIGRFFVTENFSTSAGSTVTLAASVAANLLGAVTVTRNGVVQRIGDITNDVSISGTTVTFNLRALAAGEVVRVQYPK